MIEPPRLFALVRDEDPSGISGTGTVAYGMQAPDGAVCMRWVTEFHTWGQYEDVDQLIALHGHEGRTRVEWLAPVGASSTVDGRV